MVSCFVFCRFKRKFPRTRAGHDKVLRIVKSDGKILEYRASILVKDVLLNFSDCGIGISQEAFRYLPPNYELKIGHMYYLLPSSSSSSSSACLSPSAAPPPVSPSSADAHRPGCLKRIKVVITKQQLQLLLSKTVSLEELLLARDKPAWDGVDSTTNWKPKLETIPEGNEWFGTYASTAPLQLLL
ncbi:PREDICTED: uncharacterized protein LOC104593728 [Nelumbo nucifera]|uniref:Uncharacterized protein n=2 Tax=Nelumbo nucifera TaxID=4432 RepID=A0A822YZH9_NELNU|nr:PREDICTED: uncharacterized protein LOC104593728 [Nelumbo nucifera]DAD36156.1 TPA_asm: hypothetical protein HUJ06_006796 [Nelumbo nucifera]